MINAVVEFIREKHIKPSCKNLLDNTLFTDFITTAENETTINSARSMVENKTSGAEFIKDWKAQYDTIVRNKNKEKQKENMEKRRGGYLLPSSREQKDTDMSSVISYKSNITETSTCQKQQITYYKPSVSEITTIQRAPITQYGAAHTQRGIGQNSSI